MLCLLLSQLTLHYVDDLTMALNKMQLHVLLQTVRMSVKSETGFRAETTDSITFVSCQRGFKCIVLGLAARICNKALSCSNIQCNIL